MRTLLLCLSLALLGSLHAEELTYRIFDNSGEREYSQEHAKFIFEEIKEGRNPFSLDGSFDPATIDPFEPKDVPIQELRSAKKLFERRGVTFPEGAGAYFIPSDDHHEFVTVLRNTEENMEIAGALLGSYDLRNYTPVTITLHTHLIEVPDKVATRWAEKMLGKAHHAQAFQEAQKLIADEESSQIVFLEANTRSGQRMQVQEGTEVTWISGYDETESGKLVPSTETSFHGTSLEIDPVISSSGSLVDLNFAWEHHNSAPEITRTELEINGESLPVDQTSFSIDKITTATALADGQTRIIGYFSSPDSPTLRRVLFFRLALTPVEDE